MATHLYPTPRLVDFVLSEAKGQRSRENIVVTQTGSAVLSGTVLSKVDTATTGTFAMTAGSTGNPTSGTITVTGPAFPGVYNVVFTAATKFTVEGPDGALIGTGTTGVAFSKGGLAFTLTAGGTAAVAGDSATITVAAGSGKYVPYATDGSAGPAVGILYQHLPAKTGDSKAVGFVRDLEANRFKLTGLNATAVTQLAAVGIIVRGDTNVLGVATPAL